VNIPHWLSGNLEGEGGERETSVVERELTEPDPKNRRQRSSFCSKSFYFQPISSYPIGGKGKKAGFILSSWFPSRVFVSAKPV
jgi:hypothetical protein